MKNEKSLLCVLAEAKRFLKARRFELQCINRGGRSFTLLLLTVKEERI